MKKLSKIVGLCALVMMLTTACSSDKFTIDATIEGLEGNQKAFMAVFTEEGPKIIDTTQVEKGGKFTFTGKMERSDFRQITFENQPGEIMVYMDNSSIKLTGTYTDLANVKAKGSKANDYFTEVDQMEKANNEYIQSKIQAFQNAQQTNDTVAMDALNKEVTANQKAYTDKLLEMFKKNPDEVLSMFIIGKYVDVYDINEVAGFFAKVPQVIKDDFRIKPFVENKLSKMLTLANGNPAPEFILQDMTSNDSINNAALKGKPAVLYITDMRVPDNKDVLEVIKSAKAKNADLNAFVVIYSNATPDDIKAYQAETGTENIKYVTAANVDFFESFFAVSPRTVWIDKDGKISGMSIKTEDTKKVYEAIK